MIVEIWVFDQEPFKFIQVEMVFDQDSPNLPNDHFA
jgi:hypothetical protein